MKVEDIKQEAQNRCDKRFSYLHNSAFFDGFVAGAKWRINSVWHSNTENPNRNIDKYYSGEAILIQALDDRFNFGIVYYGYGYNGNMYYTVTCIDKTYTMDEIIRWAYVKDLTPETEEFL